MTQACFTKLDDAKFVDVMDDKKIVSKFDFQEFIISPDPAYLYMYINDGSSLKKIGVVDFMAVDRWIDTKRHLTVQFKGSRKFSERVRMLSSIYSLLPTSTSTGKMWLSTIDLTKCDH